VKLLPQCTLPSPGQYSTFEVRTAKDPRALAPEVRNLVNQHNSNLPLTRVFTQTELIDMLLAQELLIARVSSFLALLALLLACIGLYGLLSFEVTRRTREIGIRIALGAQRADLMRTVIAQSIALVAAWSTIGVLAAIAVAHLTTKLLYGVKPSDPATLLSFALLLILMAIAAASIPAGRATRVDPMIALRCE
jgi:ABC-type antimicrobial peptide transport system permease subunit